MIIDEQVKAALSAYFGRYADGIIPSYRMHDMRAALEAYEQSKWVKFDASDESTHPKLLQKCLIVTNWTEYVAYFKNDDGHYFLTTDGKTVIVVNRWMPLPVFKELNK